MHSPTFFDELSYIFFWITFVYITKTHAGIEIGRLTTTSRSHTNAAHREQFSRLSPKSIVRHRGIFKVPDGRTAFLDPLKDLQITVHPGDVCTVTVLQNDPLSQRSGKFSPNSFPCDYTAASKIRYTHYGSRNPPDDKVRLQIRYDSGTDTVLVPLVLDVDVSFVIQLEIVVRSMHLTVRKLGGHSNAIDSNILQFAYNPATHICKVSVLDNGELPRYGRLDYDTANLVMQDCGTFISSGLRYKHNPMADSPNRDFIPMVVELIDSNTGEVAKREYFQMVVRIRPGIRNMAPAVNSKASLEMTANQFVTTAITTDILAAVDKETRPDLIIFNISRAPVEGEGSIVSTDDQSKPLVSFFQKDIRELKIAYKPPTTSSNVQRIINVKFRAIDKDGLKSATINLAIKIKPTRTLAPKVTKNTGLQLFEGQSRFIRIGQNIEISDQDNLSDLRISVVDGLRHGKLFVDGKIDSRFTYADLKQVKVVYQHDGSDTYSDNIIFKLYDGTHSVKFLFPVIVHPVDDEPPVLKVNTGMMVQENQVVEITPFVLSATDIDSNDESVIFSIQEPYSSFSQIVKRHFEPPPDMASWKKVSGMYEKVVKMWTQRDIVSGNLFYRHIGPHSRDIVLDKIDFVIWDSKTPPNKSNLQSMVVTVLPIDDNPPFKYPDTTNRKEIKDYKRTTITGDDLHYGDEDCEERFLVYNITTQPFDTDPNSNQDAGQIVLCDDPNSAPVKAFKHPQVLHHKLCYQPPAKEKGLTTRVIQFLFSVNDTSGNALQDQTFTIILHPVNDLPPKVVNRGMSVYQYGYDILTPNMLNANDADTDSKHIKFTLLTLPGKGKIQYNNRDVVVGTQFSRRDIRDGRVSYTNQGPTSSDKDPTDGDSFLIDVTDGVNHVPVRFHIDVQPLYGASVVPNVAPGYLPSVIEVKEGQTSPVLSELVRVTDTSTINRKLVFVLATAPQHGELIMNGQPVSNFTQQDVLRGSVLYLHTSGEIGARAVMDIFNLSVSNDSDNWMVSGVQIKGVNVVTTIHPSDNKPPTVLVTENLTVHEGSKVTLTTVHINSSDVDTSYDNVVCMIISKPKFGYLENSAPLPGSEISRMGIPLSAFSISDIASENVNYVQSIHKGLENTNDSFSFQCSDGINHSPVNHLIITIIPENDEKPELSSETVNVLEGGYVAINNDVFRVSDKDIPSDQLTFILKILPKNGVILKTFNGSINVSRFTTEDLKGSSIIYQHDNSESTTDSFLIQVSDGIHSVTRNIQVAIEPKDDETPRLVVNTGLEIKPHVSKRITSTDLSATDTDSDVSSLMFIMRHPPEHGVLQKQNFGELENVSVGMNFTQNELDSRQILYKHTGKSGVRDLIKFDITDGQNTLIDQYFYIMIEGEDTSYPTVINKGIELPEGGSTILTTDVLSTSDLDSPDENLLFRITEAPTKGHLEITDNPGVPISNFTQLQMAGSKVRYVHTSDDEVQVDKFQFEVTDGRNIVVRTFRITLTPVNNKKPFLMLGEIKLKEGSSKLITPFELNIVDHDTDSCDLVFRVTRQPTYGSLIFNNTDKIPDFFTMEDIENNMISYKHDESESNEDSFSLVVVDGNNTDFFVYPDNTLTTNQPQTMTISIESVDHSTPSVIMNSKMLDFLRNPEEKGFMITMKALRVDKRGSTNEEIHYEVTDSPKHGRLVKSNQTVSEWTQEDLRHHKLRYMLKPDDAHSEDSFTFRVNDKHGNIAENQIFKMSWSFMSFARAEYHVGESERRLRITVIRNGHVQDASYVSIKVHGITAQAGQDFKQRYTQQIQFNPGEKKKEWTLKIQNDGMHEGNESLQVELLQPVSAFLERPYKTNIMISDQEDESVVSFMDSLYKVDESIGELLIPLVRSGDTSKEMSVMCSTQHGSATGTKDDRLTSYSDFISRFEHDHRNIITFLSGQTQKFCRVKVIDDSLNEKEENFTVSLTSAKGGRLGDINKATVCLLQDKKDGPIFHFASSYYHVDEDAKSVDVYVLRTGPDISQQSTVTVKSTRSNPMTAEAGMDYLSVSTTLTFGPGVSSQRLKVSILDDVGLSKLEGPESLQLIFKHSQNAVIGEPSKATIVINDSVSDLPTMQFKDSDISVLEQEGSVSAVIRRMGDIGHISSVICYTRQNTARVGEDFIERPNTEASRVVFQPGEVEKKCRLKIVRDGSDEKDETLTLVLGSAVSKSAGHALIGNKKSLLITIKNSADKPVIRFEKTRFTVTEPKLSEDVAMVTIPIVRQGDLSGTSVVRVQTRDGSARSGKDYRGFSRELTFGPNNASYNIQIRILYDEERDAREMFTVHIRPDKNGIARVKNNKVIIYIEDRDSGGDVTFPSPPLVVSLRDYDKTNSATSNPIQGYPLICVTSCDPKHPDFPRTRGICRQEAINNTATQYRWRIAEVASDGTVVDELKDLETETFFASLHSQTLDSIFFGPGSGVQCLARAVKEKGRAGLETASRPVTIDRERGMCQARLPGVHAAEPFSAKLKYTGHNDPQFPNMVRLTVTIPHRDGMLPLLSTRKLTNLELMLSADSTRIGLHSCSNLVNADEAPTQSGFLRNNVKTDDTGKDMEPHQNDADLREGATLRFYSNLDLAGCVWRFVNHYTVSELVNQCGGAIVTDGQVLNLTQSYISMKVPLFVSNVFHSPAARGGWMSYDLQTDLKLTFVYNTAILWQKGIDAVSEEEQVTGHLYPTSMSMADDGRLNVKFRTKANFLGQFLPSHPESSFVSYVSSDHHDNIPLNLTLLRSEESFDQPEQFWACTSGMAVRDYSGLYKVNLLPCVTPPNQPYTQPIRCKPGKPVTFDLNIHFQQVSDSVPTKFNLNMTFLLMKDKKSWLSPDSRDIVRDHDISFRKGDQVMGKVFMNSFHELGSAFHVSIEKVFLCMGRDGYVPNYDPRNKQYGCAGPRPNLLHSLKILDKGSPDSVDRDIMNDQFDARLVMDDPAASSLFTQPGADGFSFKAQPLFQTGPGRQWFVHAIYTVLSEKNKNRRIRKRSVNLHHHHAITYLSDQDMDKRSADTNVFTRHKRAVNADVKNIGRNGKGTNMAHIALDYDNNHAAVPVSPSTGESVAFSEVPYMYIIIAVSAVLVLFLLTLIIVVGVKLRSTKDVPPSMKSNKTMTAVDKAGRTRTVVVKPLRNSALPRGSSDV